MSDCKNKEIILASASPRRREILENLNIKFKTVVASCDETIDENMTCEEAVMINSLRKATAVAKVVVDKDAFVIGADTVVVLDGEILTKPKNAEDAKNMLKKLSARAHNVLTGLTVFDVLHAQSTSVCETTTVYFKTLSDEEIESYIATGEPMDKAGAYGIQGIAGMFIEKIEGDYFNVVGLPVAKLYKILKEEYNVSLM